MFFGNVVIWFEWSSHYVITLCCQLMMAKSIQQSHLNDFDRLSRLPLIDCLKCVDRLTRLQENCAKGFFSDRQQPLCRAALPIHRELLSANCLRGEIDASAVSDCLRQLATSRNARTQELANALYGAGLLASANQQFSVKALCTA